MEFFLICLYRLFVFVNLLILISSMDDAFIDAYYWIRKAIRKMTVRRQYPRLKLEQLHDREEARLAIMVPAWKEFSVIAKMIENAQATLEYRNYMIFVGTYANDGETRAEVDRMVRRYRNVRRVEVPHDGPTCKADCLNWIIQTIFREEETTGRLFAGIVMHDSEDVIHPLELKLFNYLVDRKDLIQLPVLSLEREWTQWVAGTYQDDFAECHTKDMVVRESMTGLVPCAGTGVCYSRRAMAALCEETDQAPFNTSTLTEDYDFSFRLKKLGMSQVFVKTPLQYTKTVQGSFGSRTVKRFSLLGVREYFPSTFRAAYRQRARWILGIGLQGWQAHGWSGNLLAKYFMFRDRKGLFTSLISILAYLLFGGMAGVLLWNKLGMGGAAIPADFGPNSLLGILMQTNAVFMVNRVIQRFLFVSNYYGIIHGLLAIPRIVVNNVINFAAALRAWRLFIGSHLIGKRPLAWDKTIHSFPTDAELVPFRRKLGEILLDWSEMDATRLSEALAEQQASPRPLGRILMDRSWINENILADAIAFQSNLPRSALNADVLAHSHSFLPRSVLLRYGMVPLGAGEEEELLLGVAKPPSPEALIASAELLTRMPRFFILCESDLADGLAHVAFGDSSSAHPLDPEACRMLEEYFVKRSLIPPGTITEAITSNPSMDHGLFRAFLMDRGLISPELTLQGATFD